MRRLIFAAALAVSVAACGDDPLAPFEPEVTNAVDNFQFQATGVQNLTLTRDYTWRNTGTLATVNHSTTTTNGSARITILGPNGTQVYDKALAPSLNEQTNASTSGDWIVRVTLTNYSGTMNFRVQKR